MTRATLVGFVLALGVLGGQGSDARAVEATPPPPPAGEAFPAPTPLPDDPGCVGKFPGQICPLMDGGGGVCARAVCGFDRPCLRCMPAPEQAAGSDLWIPLILFGVAVMLVGSLFWFRLKRLWDAK
jgi:hypothetical protein